MTGDHCDALIFTGDPRHDLAVVSWRARTYGVDEEGRFLSYQRRAGLAGLGCAALVVTSRIRGKTMFLETVHDVPPASQ